MLTRYARVLLVSVLLMAALGANAIVAPSASAVPTWAPAATAPIHPGVQTITAGAQCTANFVFYNAGHVYIGQAAHCAGTGGPTDTNGCTSGSLPIGTPVQVGGAAQPGTLAYSSWITMQAAGETNANVCQFNDLALIELKPGDATRVNPSVPVWGGPSGLNSSGTPLGSRVYSYGNSGLRFGITKLSPKTGVSLGNAGAGWSHVIYTVTPGIPGDSGSGLLDSTGKAAGVLSTVQLAPLAASNGFGDLQRELSYLNSHTSLGVSLAIGTVPFKAKKVPLG
jgi:hypothetical protein